MKERRTGTGTGAGTGRKRGRGRGWGPVDEHRMGTGTGTGTEARTVAEMVTGTTITGTRIGLGRAEGRRKSVRNRKIAVDAARETWEHTYIYYIHTYVLYAAGLTDVLRLSST